MVRSSKEAMEAAERQTLNKPGMCQYTVRTWFDAPSAGDQDGDGDYDAVDGWKSEPASARHPGDRNPPPGKPLSFSGGSKGFGHRAMSWPGMTTRSTDMQNGAYKSGHVGFATIAQIEKAMGVKYLGWSDTIDGLPIPKDKVPVPVPPKPGYLTGDIVVCTDNLMSNPKNRDVNNALAGASPATLIGLQELNPVSFKKAAEAVPNFDLVDFPNQGPNYSNGISYDERVWELRDHYYVKEYDGKAGYSYTQYICVATLYHKRLRFEAVAMSFHAITRGNDKVRVSFRAKGLAALRKEIKKYKKLRKPIIVMGDYNATRVQHPSARIKMLHGLDHIYVWNGKGVEFEKVRTRAKNTTSDHHAFIARLKLKVKV